MELTVVRSGGGEAKTCGGREGTAGVGAPLPGPTPPLVVIAGGRDDCSAGGPGDFQRCCAAKLT